MNRADCLRHLIFTASLLLGSVQANAQASLPLYTDHLVNGYQDWSYNCTRVFTNASPVHSGSGSVSVTINSSFGALSLEQNISYHSGPYASLSFWINGGRTGGQQIQVYGTLNHGSQPSYGPITLPTNSWQQITIPLSSLNVANKTNFTGIAIQGATSGAKPVFYVDDIQLVAAPAPAPVHLSVDAGQTLRPADARWFGINTATWDGNLSQATTNIGMFREIGCLTLRWPGGSTSDTYHWNSDNTGNFRFRNIATNLGAQVFITVNYGSGTAAEAANWVRSANITNNCKFKYWEIGNECYGSWENDINIPAHDPYTYAVRATNYIALMKAVDPTIKVGVVVITGEDSYVNNTMHPALNPRTGQTHNGWTPVLLTTLKNLGVTPDFAVYHVYPQWTDPSVVPVPAADSDPILLQASEAWARDAADLRQQITDYFGPAGTNIELICTENNSDPSSAFGRQLTSIVNGLYLADSVCQLMKTEFNGYLWWDWRNGPNSTGTFDPTLYGWRTYGDEGMLNGVGARYPMFYTFKILQHFVRPGDTVLKAASDYSLLAAYSARKTNGALTLLVINKDATTNFNAQIAVTNFVPWPTANVRSYGIPQDEAVRTNGPASLQDIQASTFASAGTNFGYSFAPYSLTVLTLAPDAARLQPVSATATEFVLQLQGQSGVPYVIQTSSNLFAWTPISTNRLTGTTLEITNAVTPGSSRRFWRALWQP
jgi:alpha-L-arabinofuranosidase